jgi:hypothetical protein
MFMLPLLLAVACRDVTINVDHGEDDSGGVPGTETEDTEHTGDTDTEHTEETEDTEETDETGGTPDTEVPPDTGSEVWTGGGPWTAAGPTTVFASDPSHTVEAIWLRDVTGDGHTDLVIAEYHAYQRVLRTLPGDGLGGFGAESVSVGTTAVYSGYQVAMGDLNGDGFPDVVAPSQQGVQVFFGSAAGFSSDVGYDRGYRTGDAAGMADLDGDGTDELHIWSTDAVGVQQSEYLRWDGTGLAPVTPLISWQPFVTIYGTMFPTEFVAYDDDGDGRESALLAGLGIVLHQDMFVTGMGSGGALIVNQGYMQTRYSADGALFADVADLDGDGDHELVTGGYDGLQVYDPSSGLAATPFRLDTSFTYGVALVTGDLNGDAYPDVVELVASYTKPLGGAPTALVSSHLGNGTDIDPPTAIEIRAVASAGVMRAIAIGDLSEDRCGDVAFLAGYPQSVFVLHGVCGA